MTGAILPNGILNETIASVTDILGPGLDGISVERVAARKPASARARAA